MTKIDTSTEALQRYWNPQGGGVEPHDAGLLYLRNDVDAAISALTAERDALRAENERLLSERPALPDELKALVAELRAYREFSEGSTGADWAEVDVCMRAADAIEALKGADNG